MLQYFPTKLCNFTKCRMLFQAMIKYLPSSNFLKIPSKSSIMRLKHSILRSKIKFDFANLNYDDCFIEIR